MRNWWDRWTDYVTLVTGGRWAFGISVLLTVLWVAVGPFYGWSDTWQLWANTVTTVITYLMVFVIQHAQNKADAATQLKLDELVRAVKEANNQLIAADRQGEQEIERLRSEITPD